MSDDNSRVPTGQETFKNVKITKIVDPLMLGEGPRWDHENNVLLFVDIEGKSVHKYDCANSKHHMLKLDERVSLIIPIKGEKNEYLITQGKKLMRLKWDDNMDHKLKYLTAVSGVDGPGIMSRLNDGKADHLGNVWLGTMALDGKEIKLKHSEFYRYSCDGKLKTIATSVSISNGIGWSVKQDRMYYIDTPERRVDVFDYDSKTGEATNRRPFFNFQTYDLKGSPDGMTTDCDDNLWIATWGGSQVLKVSGKTGLLLGTLALPAELITSVIFGGKDLDKLFVTSAKYSLQPEDLKRQPLAGAVFMVEGLGIKGAASNCAIIPPGIELDKE